MLSGDKFLKRVARKSRPFNVFIKSEHRIHTRLLAGKYICRPVLISALIVVTQVLCLDYLWLLNLSLDWFICAPVLTNVFIKSK